jgi:hypothetical protein
VENAIVPVNHHGSSMIDWPPWTANSALGREAMIMLNLNTTGGVEEWHNVTTDLHFRQWRDPGVTNVF